MPGPHFARRDPNDPAFWDERFTQRFMPWDQGGVPPMLARFVADAPTPLVTLIPGCGLGHEVRHLALAQWDVTAIDFSPAAVASAHLALHEFAGHVQQADFFTFQPERPLGFIYERAFLCALPRERWPAVAARWAELLPAGALLGGFFFFDDAPKGPPFGAGPDDIAALLRTAFVLEEDVAVEQSIAVFAGKERWQLWRRRND
ncbi:SAM-dependent methyltransferase [Actimicrobium sp. GrIS 1.19]|uniref:methyltransferase domain-containing protein n=1 Tax=Actimicrobium sp. GrIS 1.19 TaxID=3071708 RepID=UPI002E07F4BB|nr:SAM-dependent methyltransferase [Actimicrobium sp. GrIS 1.19]